MSHANKTVIRSMKILDLFLEEEELTFQEIIDLSGMPKSSVYRMLSSLETMEFLEKGSDNKFRLGLIFLKYGSLVSARLNIRQIALPIMQELHNELEEAVNLTIKQDDTQSIYIEKLEYKQKVRLYTAVGRMSPLYAGASSRIILSFLPESFTRNYLENAHLKKYAKGTITDKNQIVEMLERGRKNYYTLSYSELHDHTAEMAAPIFNHEGKVVAALSLAGIEANYGEENIALYSKKLIRAVENISQRLGYRKSYF
ncbi:MAG TPA: IclR family transcriptional regulator [Bacillota bacterium]|nr:IclR family transcriptional regulator [Bacillota bacterium]